MAIKLSQMYIIQKLKSYVHAAISQLRNELFSQWATIAPIYVNEVEYLLLFKL